MGILAAPALRGDWNSLKGLFPALISGIFFFFYDSLCCGNRKEKAKHLDKLFQALGTKGKGNVRADENEVAVAAGEQLRDQSLDRTLGVGEGRKISLSPSGRSWAAFPLAEKREKSPRGPDLCVVLLPGYFPPQITKNPNPGVCLGSLLPQGQLGLGLCGRKLQQQMGLWHLWDLMKLNTLLAVISMELHPWGAAGQPLNQHPLPQDVSAALQPQPAAV